MLPIALLALVGLLALPSTPAGATGRAKIGFPTPHAASQGAITSPVPPYTGAYLEVLNDTGTNVDVPTSVTSVTAPGGDGRSLQVQLHAAIAGSSSDTVVINVDSTSSAPLQAGGTYGTGAAHPSTVTIQSGDAACVSTEGFTTAVAQIDQLTITAGVVEALGLQVYCSEPDSLFLSFYGAIAERIVPTTPHAGYYTYDSNGLITPFGNDNYLNYLGDLSETALNQPVVGMAQTADGGGYWMVATDGGIFTYGDAHFYGSMGGSHLNEPIVGMAETKDGKGYWLVASDGGIFAFGDATFYGSMGGQPLNKPIVGMAPAPNGNGYWLVAADGGIFAFGDAPFYGSAGNIQLNKPVVGMTPTLDGKGYWFVASDGGIFNYGDATFHGSAGNLALAQPIVGMAITSDGGGYWLVAADGGIFGYNAPYYGSIPGSGGSVTDVVGLSTLPGLSV